MVEVLVSIAIIAVLVTAVLPHLIASLKSNDAAARNTAAKTIAQAELALMRNLPYNVAPEAGDFIDMFDRYFRDLNAPAATPACLDSDGEYQALTTAARGYVAAGAPRCGYEPAGAMYRQVRTETQNPDLAGYVVVVNTQFINNNTPPAPVTPPAGYNTQDDARDTPAATQVSVTVTVLPTDDGVRVPVSTHTQISKTSQPVTRIETSLDVTSLSLGTTSPLGFPVTLHAGRIDANGNLTYASTVNVVASSIGGFLASGDRNAGANAVVNAPPAVTRPLYAAGSGSISASGCLLGCWGGSQVDAITATATDGLPNAGSSSAPLGVHVRQPSAGGTAYAFGAGTGSVYRDSMRLTENVLVRSRASADTVFTGTTPGCTTPTSGTAVRVSAGGWLRSTAPDAGMSVDVCGTAQTGGIAVMPTDFAPSGVVRVHLNYLNARCLVAGASHSAATSFDYSARVERWTPAGYVTVATVTPATGTDELAAVDLSTTQVGTYGPLSQWIDSWSSITPDRVQTSSGDDGARVEIPGIVTLSTPPTRYQVTSTGALVYDGSGNRVIDPQSTLSLSLGNLTCAAKDAR